MSMTLNYNDYAEFKAAVDELLTNPVLAYTGGHDPNDMIQMGASDGAGVFGIYVATASAELPETFDADFPNAKWVSGFTV